MHSKILPVYQSNSILDTNQRKGGGAGENVIGVMARVMLFPKTVHVIGQFLKSYCVMQNLDVMCYWYVPETLQH